MLFIKIHICVFAIEDLTDYTILDRSSTAKKTAVAKGLWFPLDSVLCFSGLVSSRSLSSLFFLTKSNSLQGFLEGIASSEELG